jgi:hypothetical protein
MCCKVPFYMEQAHIMPMEGRRRGLGGEEMEE